MPSPLQPNPAMIGFWDWLTLPWRMVWLCLWQYPWMGLSFWKWVGIVLQYGVPLMIEILWLLGPVGWAFALVLTLPAWGCSWLGEKILNRVHHPNHRGPVNRLIAMGKLFSGTGVKYASQNPRFKAAQVVLLVNRALRDLDYLLGQHQLLQPLAALRVKPGFRKFHGVWDGFSLPMLNPRVGTGKLLRQSIALILKSLFHPSASWMGQLIRMVWPLRRLPLIRWPLFGLIVLWLVWRVKALR